MTAFENYQRSYARAGDFYAAMHPDEPVEPDEETQETQDHLDRVIAEHEANERQ